MSDITDVKLSLSKAEKYGQGQGDIVSPKCYHKSQFYLYRVLKNANFLRKFKYFSEIFHFYRIKYTDEMYEED
jgi:hypothetical protein